MSKAVHINDLEWKYMVGRSNVLIEPPQGSGIKKFYITFEQLLGTAKYRRIINDDDFNGRVAIWPSDVKRYIEENIRMGSYGPSVSLKK